MRLSLVIWLLLVRDFIFGVFFLMLPPAKLEELDDAVSAHSGLSRCWWS